MEKKDTVLVAINKKSLKSEVKNLKSVKLSAIFLDAGKNKTFGKNKIPIISFAKVDEQIKKYKDSTWLISGAAGNAFDRLKKFLMAGGIPEENIIKTGKETSDVAASNIVKNEVQISPTYLANLNYIKEHGADFFATGNEYTRDGLNLKFINGVNGVILADEHQDLWQSYLTAKNVFSKFGPKAIKFVLIGLTPDAFHYAPNFDAENFFETTNEHTDLNFDAVKKIRNRKFSIKAVVDWNDSKPLTNDAIEDNIQILKDYIDLCNVNGTRAIGVVFPFAPVVRENYDEKLLISFRETIRQIEESCDFKCVDMFDLNIGYDCFSDMTHLNNRGMINANSYLAMRLYEFGLLSIQSFCDMTYEYFNFLSNVAPKDDYNAFMEKVFKASAKMIRRKDKIKLGFVLYLSAEWCGDDLYYQFVNDKRFETNIFLCRRLGGGTDNELFHKDFLRGIEQFKSHNLKVVPVDEINTDVPAQDVLIFLIPYFAKLPRVFRPANMTVKTLMAHIPYSFDIAIRSRGYYNRAMFHTAWRLFFSSKIGLEVYALYNSVELQRGIYSGYPRMDIFFDKKASFQFEWKMTHPDAKKIIWAPHWSINGVTNYATFQWNYKFMYEFAKAHPEISWVVKPHPGLFFAAVDNGVFPSTEKFKEYLQAWDDLPNAQVYTGAYYQAVFATSDGMIHDSGSFIAEYQFVDKPMIFLTRAGEKFNGVGHAILEASYLVDGKDFDAIAKMIQKVFVKGDDYKAAQRREVFDKYLNYPKATGMLASEFIYHSIADELKP